MQTHHFCVYKALLKSSSAAGRTRRRLGNTSTCPQVRFNILQSHHQLQDALDHSMDHSIIIQRQIYNHSQNI